MSKRDVLDHLVKVDGKGRVGLNTIPSAYLHLPPSPGITGSAPFKLSAGVSLIPSVESGAIEYDGKNFYATADSTRWHMALSGAGNLSDTTVANTTTETPIFAAAAPANSSDVSDVMEFNTFGMYSTANGSDVFALRFKLGTSTIIGVTSTASAVSNAPFSAHMTVTVRSIGISGTIMSFGEIHANNAKTDASSATLSVINTTAGTTFSVTVQWSNALAGNALVCQQGYVKKL